MRTISRKDFQHAMLMESKQHRDPHVLADIVRKAYQMNLEGKQRKRPISVVLGRILRDYTPNADDLASR
jgi:hypothetical protein